MSCKKVEPRNKVNNLLHQCHPVQEVQETIDAVAMDHIHGRKHRYKVMFVCGDQQTYDRMWELKRLYPEQYKWLILETTRSYISTFLFIIITSFHHLSCFFIHAACHAPDIKVMC